MVRAGGPHKLWLDWWQHDNNLHMRNANPTALDEMPFTTGGTAITSLKLGDFVDVVCVLGQGQTGTTEAFILPGCQVTKRSAKGEAITVKIGKRYIKTGVNGTVPLRRSAVCEISGTGNSNAEGVSNVSAPTK